MTAPALTADEARQLIVRHLEAIDQLRQHIEAADPAPWQPVRGRALTPRERQVARAYAWSGTSLEAVARELYISVNTAKTHLRVIYEKLGVHCRAEMREALLRAEQVPAGEAA